MSDLHYDDDKKMNTNLNKTKIAENSSLIAKIVYNNKDKISSNKCPDEITLEMLKMEMDCMDLRSRKNVDINQLWKSYCVTNLTKSMFGFYIDPLEMEKIDKKIEIPIVEEIKEMKEKEIKKNQ